MAGAIIPGVQAAGSAIASKLPSVVAYAKKNLPQAYDQLVQKVATTGKTPEQWVSAAAKKKDDFYTQAVIENFIRAGVPQEVLVSTLPGLNRSDLEKLTMQHIRISGQQQQAANSRVTQIEGDSSDPDALFDEQVGDIKWYCRKMGIHPDELIREMELFATIGPAHVQRYLRQCARRKEPVVNAHLRPAA